MSKPITAVLRYPTSWRTEGNPRRFEVCARVGSWMRELGILHDPASLAGFDALAASGYGGWPFPRAAEAELETITRFLTLWILEDDPIEGIGKEGEDELVRAVAGEPAAPPAADGLLRGWWETARRYHGMGDAWLARHAERFRAWLGSVRDEAAQVRRYHEQGVCATLEEYLEVRRVNVGVLPTLDLLEHSLGRPLSDDVLRHPAVRAIERAASEAVALINDLFGFSKDRRARWLGAVTCLAAETGVPTADAFRQITRRHNARVCEIEQLSTGLRSHSAAEPLLERWLSGVQEMIYGFARWHAEAPRYSPVHVLEEGAVVRLRVG